MAISLFALALLQAGAGDVDPAITVTPDASRETAEQFVNRIEPVSQPNDEPLARYTDPVCVGSAGLPAEAAQVIVDRVSEVAASVGLRTGAPGCAPNLMVVFDRDTTAAVQRLSQGRSRAVASQSRDDIRRIADEAGQARAWTEVVVKSRDGDLQSQDTPNNPPSLRVSTSTRLSMPIRRDILSATVLIERDAVAGRNLTQIADYAAMRALTGARSRGELGASSILSLFTPQGDSRAPEGLTALDRGYLKGLYSGRGDLWPMVKRDYIARSILRERLAGGPE
ncbi:hypothetical protein [Novosphingobium sp.]|jgi:hypothetical protein|uniref:hypothetical protein n=1 Tax=Novosphingobium sp. TaxID=1874826 RepID=UPI002FE06DA0